MAAEKIIFETLILNGTNKGGVLKPDADGYYTVVLGILNADATDGDFYTYNAKVEAVFANSGQCNKRAYKGLLRGEYGHPDPGEYATQYAFEVRVRRINEKFESHTIRKVWTKEMIVEGRTVMAIVGELRPQGPYGKYLKDALDNPHCNVAFSGRYYSKPTQVGVKCHREIYAVGTWDYVSEEGMPGSHKYSSPTLQCAAYFEMDVRDMAAAVEMERTDKSAAMTLQSGGLTAAMLYGEHIPNQRGRSSLSW
jgi:hypothetical protein